MDYNFIWSDKRSHLKFFLKILLLCTGVLFFKTNLSFALSLEESIALARENLPSHKASKINVDSKESLYKASLSPYLPRLGASGKQEHFKTGLGNSDINSYTMSLDYTLFDGGHRKADRNIARLNLDSSREEFRDSLIDLEYNVKVMYFTGVAKKEILGQRKMQVDDSQKVYEIASEKHKHGAALLSDVLQASVRLKQAMFDLRRAKGESAKSMFDLNSFLGRPIQTPYDLDEKFNPDIRLPDMERLRTLCLDKPVAKQASNAVEISKNNIFNASSKFYPKFTASLSYTKTDGNDEITDRLNREKSAMIMADFNIFELKKFYNKKSFKKDLKASLENKNNIMRELALNLHKKYEDFLTFRESLVLAGEHLKETEFNYAQALGEYKAGKGDILSLVSAESLLADSRNLVSESRLNFAISTAALEQAAGIKNLAIMEKVSVP